MTLVADIRAFLSGDYTGHELDIAKALASEAADRIEQLEAALREARDAIAFAMHVIPASKELLETIDTALEPKPPTPANDDPEEIDTDNIGGLH
jgi:hypothetical protein